MSRSVCYRLPVVVGMRFRPPRVSFKAETLWVLNAAFSENTQSFADVPHGGLDAEQVEATADQLDLRARIAARWIGTGVPDIEGVLGGEVASRFRAAYEASCVHRACREMVIRQLVAAGRQSGIPLVFLKGCALEFLGCSPKGSRNTHDVDVLLPRDRCQEFADLLKGRGFSSSGLRAPAYHLPPMVHESGVVVELHLQVSSVAVAGLMAPDAMELSAAGCCHVVTHNGLEVVIPSVGTLVAHLIAHGIAQHGFSRDDYPVSRMFGDLIDVDQHLGDVHNLIARSRTVLEPRVNKDEILGLQQLTRALVRGRCDDDGFQNTQGRLLLEHAVAGAKSRIYSRHLAFDRVFRSDPAVDRGAIVRRFVSEPSPIETAKKTARFSMNLVGAAIWRTAYSLRRLTM
jgi:hypothetical protein